MFSFLKRDPARKLKKRHSMLLEQAMRAQRNGDIRTYSKLTAEAEELFVHIKKLSADDSQ
ncbi:DUF6435 family protein [Vibrio maritimus]|uniref:DUF6435 family protein n=1 Tax=Vibrio maritimus TaxID=990268 RepID=UPI0037355166